jgi:hypothetical protein
MFASWLPKSINQINSLAGVSVDAAKNAYPASRCRRHLSAVFTLDGFRPKAVPTKFKVLHGFPGNAALIVRKKKALSRQP